ncbi:MAG: AMP-binding protein, partial [Berryella intestinalis]|uniref:AMP-binding enzyme n=1 Tax=Berryella intestinalis TaxID=1531429 RepID=UPI002A762810
TELRIIDPETGERKPAGESGEIVIVGDTVAKGYYRSPDKTAAAFFAARLSDETPVRGYRTGDQGFLDERGNLRFEGRLDHLVKMNGFRIELGDIECNLMSLEGVKQAAVIPVVRNNQIRSLKAFVVMDDVCKLDGLELAQGLKAQLAERIPAYMVPRAFSRLQSMPLTPNAKIDRRALAAMGR